MNQLIDLRVLTLIVFTNLALLWQVKAVDVTDTFYGTGAFNASSTGLNDSAFGYNALNSETSGDGNTASGAAALLNNTTGSYNTATGFKALQSNTTIIGASGDYNTANGASALFSNTTGSRNTADGFQVLYFNTTGYNNAASGYQALLNNTTGTYNTADGFNALFNNTTGYWNVAIGANAGRSLTTGGGNVCIGVNVLGVAGESNTTRIRNVYSTIASGRAVYVNADNKIGTLVSSRRYKEEIKSMDKASETLFALKPVTFRYKKEIDPARALSFGLIAEEVAKISPDLVTRDEEGNPQTVRYDAVNAMLLNEFLKEHCKVQKLEAALDAVNKRLKRQDAKIAELQVSKPPVRIVSNNQ